MEIKRSGSQPSGKGPADWFTGVVRIDPLFQSSPRIQAAGERVDGVRLDGVGGGIGHVKASATRCESGYIRTRADAKHSNGSKTAGRGIDRKQGDRTRDLVHNIEETPGGVNLAKPRTRPSGDNGASRKGS